MTLGDITAKLVADTKGFNASMDEVGKKVEKTATSSSGVASKIGDAFKKVGQASLVAVTAATTGLVALTTASVNAYGEYEQMVGGVGKLFGDSANEVISNSKRAYETAGLSANAYMETVTGFSARLLQGLGGDTKKAAEYADMAVRDMADNANIFGTNIESIQNAYQGFAKQNFTMLDNLKLGYGGTATEMARLINDTGVMGESFKATAENVKNVPFDKYIEAIHKVQEETGITGTTTMEASKTIQGSLNSAKASWTNLLTALGTGDLTEVESAVMSFGTSVSNVITNISAILPSILEGMLQVIQQVFSSETLNMLITGILELVPRLVQTAMELVMALVNGIRDNLPMIMKTAIQVIDTLLRGLIDLLPMILEMGIEILLALIKGIGEIVPDLIPLVIDMVILMVDTLIDNLPMIIETGMEVIMALMMGLINELPRLAEYIPTIIIKIVEVILSNLPMIISMGVKIIVELIVGLISAIPVLVKSIPAIVNAIVNGLANALPQMMESGKELVKGLWNGIKDASQWIKDKISGWVGDINKFFKKAFGIASPSKVMEDEIGWNLGAGIAQGIENSIGLVERAMGDVEGAVSAMVSPNISPNILGDGLGGAGFNISINMAGANISSPDVAQDYAEQIGDAIIGKLRTNRRSYV